MPAHSPGLVHIQRKSVGHAIQTIVNSNINILLFVKTEIKKIHVILKRFLKKVDLLTFYTFCSNNVG